MGGLGTSRSTEEMVTEWTHKLRKEGNNIERQIRGIQRKEEEKKRMIKDSARRGERDSCRILAKEIVKADKQIKKLYASKAQLSSVQMNMKHQLATLRVAGAFAKSTDVKKSMQMLIKVPEIQATMREMYKEMSRAGIIEEMMDDAMESLDNDDLKEEADEEIEKVLYEITAGELGKAPPAASDSLPVIETEGARAGPSRVAAAASAVAIDENIR